MGGLEDRQACMLSLFFCPTHSRLAYPFLSKTFYSIL